VPQLIGDLQCSDRIDVIDAEKLMVPDPLESDVVGVVSLRAKESDCTRGRALDW